MADFLDAIFSTPAPAAAKTAEPGHLPPSPPQVASPVSATATNPGQSAALEARIRQLEEQLLRERERALASEMKLKQMQEAQAMVEQTLEKMYEKTVRERHEQDMRIIREKAMARVEALEGRLDEFQRGVLDLLKQQNETRRQSEQEFSRQSRHELDARLARFAREVVDLMCQYWDSKEKALKAYLRACQDQIQKSFQEAHAASAEAGRINTRSISLMQELRLLSAGIEQANQQIRSMLETKFLDLDRKVLLSGKVRNAVRVVLAAIDRLDPLLVDPSVFQELQRLKEDLQKEE